MRRQTTLILASFGLLLSSRMLIAQPQTTAAPAINRWTRTADLTAARAQACASVLKDGRLLVAGGLGVSGPVATVDIYGADGSFVAGPPMSQARAQAACVTLTDGTVLVMGGDGGSGALSSAEIFDPVAGAWSAASNLATAREGHQAIITAGGTVWIAGGTNQGVVVGTLEVYSSGQFRTVGALNTPRAEFAMAASGERMLYVAGGTDGTNVLNTVESYDSFFGTVAVVGTMSQARKDFAAAALLDGTLLLIGGLDRNAAPLSSTEIFDPVAGTSTAGPSLLAARSKHAAVALSGNGSILIYGGKSATTTLGTSEIYTPWTGAITAATQLNAARRDQANVMLRPGNLMVAGGRDDNGPLASSELFQFANLQTDKADYAPGTPVHITGGGWVPGEQVLVTLTAFPVDKHHIEFTGAAAADGAGNIVLDGFAVDRSHLGMKFLATAVGSQSQAEMTFTDQVNPQISVALGTYTSGTNTLNLAITAAPDIPADQTPTGTVVLCSGTVLGTNQGTCPSAYVPTAATGYVCSGTSPYSCTLYCGASTPCTLPSTASSGVTVVVNPPTGTTTFGAGYAADAQAQANNYNAFLTADKDTAIATFVNKATTATTVAGPASANYGSVTTYTATVTPTPSQAATGTVDFCDNATGTCTGPSDGTKIGSATLSSNVATFNPTTPLAVGAHKISAYYEGDGANQAGASTNFQATTINTQNTAIALTLNATPTPITTVYGQPVSATLTVTDSGGGTGVPTGSVSLTDTSTSTTIINNQAINGSAQYTLASITPPLAAGAHNLSFSYTPTGGTGYAASSNTATPGITVNAASTTAAAPAFISGDTSFAQTTPIYMLVTVTANAPSTVNPANSGTVSVYDQSNSNLLEGGAVTLGTANANCGAVASNQACVQITPKFTTSGNHLIYAVYTTGNTNYNSSANPGPTTILNISPPVATTWGTPSGPASVTFGQTLNLTGSIAANSGGNNPDGHAQFIFDGNTSGAANSGNVNVSSNTGATSFFAYSPSTTVLGGGAHTVQTTAYVSSSGGFVTPPVNSIAPNAASSPTYSFTINPATANFTLSGTQTLNSSTVNLTSSPNVLVTSTVNLTATYSGALSPTPTGTVTFYNSAGGLNSTTGFICSGTLTSGVATCSATAGPGGPAGLTIASGNSRAVTLAIAYPGDNNYSLGTSSALNFTVLLASTTTTVAVSSADSLAAPPIATQVGRLVTVVATTTTSGIIKNPTGTLTVTQPAANVSGWSCGAATASGNNALTVTCTFTVVGPIPAPPSLSFTASYAGDSYTQASNNTSTPATLTIQTLITATSLVGSATPDPLTAVQINRPVTLTATVSSTSGITGVPATGTVTFTLSGTYTVTSCGTLTGTNQYTVSTTGGPIFDRLRPRGPAPSPLTATCSFTVQGPPGTFSYNATYNGDANTAASTAPTPVSVTVVKDTTTTTLTVSSDLDPTTATQAGRVVTLQAVTTSTLAATPVTGTWTFTLPVNTYTSPNCGTQSGNTFTVTQNAPPANGTTTVTCTFTVTGPAQSNTYTVNYSGDANNQGTSAPLPSTTIVVILATTNTSFVITDLDPTTATQIGRVITLSATATTNPNVFDTPTGSFTFNFPQGAVQVNNTSGAGCGNLTNGGLSATVTTTTTSLNTGAGGFGTATASCTFIITQPAGQANTYTVKYNGDTNTATSTSAPQTITTILANTTTSFAIGVQIPGGASDTAANPQTGRLVTLSATTVTQANDFANPTGTFTFNFPQGATMVNNTSPAGCGNLVTGGKTATVSGTPTINAATGGNSTSTASCTFIVTGPAQANSYTVTYNPDVNTNTSNAAAQTLTTKLATTYSVLTITSPDGLTNPTQLGRQITLTATTYTDPQVYLAPTASAMTIVPPAGTAASSTCGTPSVTVQTNDVSNVVTNALARPRAIGGSFGNPNALNGQLTETCTYTLVGPMTGPSATKGSTSFASVVNYAGDTNTQSGALLNPPTLSTIASPTCFVPNGPTVDTRGTVCLATNLSLPFADSLGTSFIYGQPITIPLGLDTLTSTLAAGSTPGLPSVGINPTGTVTFTGIPNIPATPIFNLPASGSNAYPALVTLVSEPTTAATNNVTLLTPNVLTAGSYNVSAVYSGDANYQGYTQPISFTINKAQTQMMLQPLSVTASIPNLKVVVANLSVPGVGTPTGVIQVATCAGTSGGICVSYGPVIASASLSPTSSCAPLPSSISQCSVASVLVPSGSNYVGIYCGATTNGACAGDPNFSPANLNTGAGTAILGPGNTVTGLTATDSLSLSASPNPAVPGQTVTITASLSFSGGQTPTGSIQFLDNGVLIGTAPLLPSAGGSLQATITVTLGPGTHSLGATYNGDFVYPASTTNFNLSVTKPAPSATFSSSLTTSVFGQQVVLTVRFTSSTQGGSLPTGTVQFLNNGQPIGNPVQIANGVATLTLSNLPTGVNSIGVQYSGDSTYAVLTKNVGSVLVTQAQTTVALTSSASGNQMTLAATVSVVSPGAGTPTGSVQFIDSVTQAVLGTGTLNSSGVATATVPFTGDSIVAVYQGDANFLTSTSPKSSAATISLSNSASYVQAYAPGEIVVAFGTGLTTQTVSGSLPLVNTLGGVTVTITDSAGVPRQAPLFYVSPTQISFMIPAQTATGQATVTVATSTGSLTGTITVTASTGALFTANANGSGPLAAQVVVTTPGGQQTYVNTAALNGNTYVNAPISLSPTSNTYYLLLYGTGFDNAKTVTVTINGQTFNPAYAGPQGAYPGLDQINVLLPSSLIGAGQVNVSITVDGQVSNVGTIAFASGGTN